MNTFTVNLKVEGTVQPTPLLTFGLSDSDGPSLLNFFFSKFNTHIQIFTLIFGSSFKFLEERENRKRIRLNNCYCVDPRQ